MKKIILYILIIISLIPAVSLAQTPAPNPGDYKLLAPLPCIDGVGSCNPDKTMSSINFKDYISYIFKFAIALSVFLAVIMIIWGGFEYMTSQIPYMKISGKAKMGDAIIGLIMVLASYLILETIDPRLVNVYTEIPKIQISQEDLDAVRAFSDKLSGDLRKLTSEKQLKVVELENKKYILEKQQLAIENELMNFNASSNARDYEKRDEIEVRLAKVKGELEKTDNEQIKNIAEGVGALNFKKAYEAIQNPLQANDGVLDAYRATTTSNTPVNGKLQTDSTNKLQVDYNNRINELSPNASEDARVLGLQRDFYIEQVKEEYDLKYKIEYISGKNILPKNIVNLVYEIIYKSDLADKLVEYRANMGDAKKVANSGLTDIEYKNIMQIRIDKIEKVTGK